jgi:hypothetical protein
MRLIFALLLCLQKFLGSFALCHHWISFVKKAKSELKVNAAVASKRNGRLLLLSPQSLSKCHRRLYFSSSDVAIEDDQLTRANYTLVQRTYDTYQWKDKYNINYRVEGPLGGKPILLVHGFGANVVSDLSAKLKIYVLFLDCTLAEHLNINVRVSVILLQPETL